MNCSQSGRERERESVACNERVLFITVTQPPQYTSPIAWRARSAHECRLPGISAPVLCPQNTSCNRTQARRALYRTQSVEMTRTRRYFINDHLNQYVRPKKLSLFILSHLALYRQNNAKMICELVRTQNIADTVFATERMTIKCISFSIASRVLCT